jgi:hypothetical protein
VLCCERTGKKSKFLQETAQIQQLSIRACNNTKLQTEKHYRQNTDVPGTIIESGGSRTAVCPWAPARAGTHH